MNRINQLSDTDKAWLAGLLEGEGSFMHHPTIRAAIRMTDEDVISKAANLIGVTYHTEPGKRIGWKRQFYFYVCGKLSLDLMKAILPWMGSRRTAAINRAIIEWDGKTKEQTTEPIIQRALLVRGLRDRGLSQGHIARLI